MAEAARSKEAKARLTVEVEALRKDQADRQITLPRSDTQLREAKRFNSIFTAIVTQYDLLDEAMAFAVEG